MSSQRKLGPCSAQVKGGWFEEGSSCGSCLPQEGALGGALELLALGRKGLQTSPGLPHEEDEGDAY